MSFKFLRIRVKKVVTLQGREFPIDSVVTINDNERITWACDDDVILAICDSSIVVMDGVGEIEGISNQINYLKDFSSST